jgi:hypothetical protein
VDPTAAAGTNLAKPERAMAHLALKMRERASLVQENRLRKASFALALALRPFMDIGSACFPNHIHFAR